jgi:peptidoglycan/LPS O-acetylase OafA/YrhL
MNSPLPTPPPPKHLPLLDGLRGLLAVYVLCYHVFVVGLEGMGRAYRLASAPFRLGHSAVGAFIVLSGFSLMLPVVATGSIPGGLGNYVRRRARRILPAYYAALVFSMLMVTLIGSAAPDGDAVARRLGLGDVIAHLLLIHNLIPGLGMSINAVLWSVATEWHIYFLFPLVLLPAWRRFGPAGALGVGFGLGLVPQLVAPGGYLLSWCPWYLGLFAMGMLAAVSYASPDGSWRRLPRLAALGVAAAILLKWKFPESDDVGRFSLYWLRDGAVGLIFWGAIGYGAGIDRDAVAAGRPRGGALVVRWLGGRPLAGLGSISYSLYATHMPIVNVLDALSRWLHLGTAGTVVVRAVVGIPLSIAFAATFASRFEWPFLRRASGIPPRSRPAPGSAAEEAS